MVNVRLIDIENNDKQREVFVAREPQERERLYLRNGEQAMIISIGQLVRNTNTTNEPDFVAMVSYEGNGSPALIDLKN